MGKRDRIARISESLSIKRHHKLPAAPAIQLSSGARAGFPHDAARIISERKLHPQLRGSRWSDDVDWLAKVRLVDRIEIVLSVVRMISEIENLEQALKSRSIGNLAQPDAF